MVSTPDNSRTRVAQIKRNSVLFGVNAVVNASIIWMASLLMNLRLNMFLISLSNLLLMRRWYALTGEPHSHSQVRLTQTLMHVGWHRHGCAIQLSNSPTLQTRPLVANMSSGVLHSKGYFNYKFSIKIDLLLMQFILAYI